MERDAGEILHVALGAGRIDVLREDDLEPSTMQAQVQAATAREERHAAQDVGLRHRCPDHHPTRVWRTAATIAAANGGGTGIPDLPHPLATIAFELISVGETLQSRHFDRPQTPTVPVKWPGPWAGVGCHRPGRPIGELA